MEPHQDQNQFQTARKLESVIDSMTYPGDITPVSRNRQDTFKPQVINTNYTCFVHPDLSHSADEQPLLIMPVHNYSVPERRLFPWVKSSCTEKFKTAVILLIGLTQIMFGIFNINLVGYIDKISEEQSRLPSVALESVLKNVDVSHGLESGRGNDNNLENYQIYGVYYGQIILNLMDHDQFQHWLFLQRKNVESLTSVELQLVKCVSIVSILTGLMAMSLVLLKKKNSKTKIYKSSLQCSRIV